MDENVFRSVFPGKNIRKKRKGLVILAKQNSEHWVKKNFQPQDGMVKSRGGKLCAFLTTSSFYIFLAVLFSVLFYVMSRLITRILLGHIPRKKIHSCLSWRHILSGLEFIIPWPRYNKAPIIPLFLVIFFSLCTASHFRSKVIILRGYRYVFA